MERFIKLFANFMYEWDTSLIIQSIKTEIKSKDGTACIYFFFQEDDKHHVSPACIWATLLIQLLEIKAVGVSNDLKARIGNPFQKSALIDSSEYLDLLRAQAVAFTSVYLVIDGLDRCRYNTSRAGALKEVSESLRNLPSHVRILFTSRDSYIGEEIGTSQKIPITPMDADVRAYVKKRIADDTLLSKVLRQPEHREYVILRVTTKALSSRMFLSAKLHVDVLTRQTSFHDIKTALKTLPDSSLALKWSTKKVAQRINETDDGDCHLSKHILMWVIHAKEKINIKQIQDSFAIQKSEGQCYEHYRPVKEAVMRACTELVIRDPEKETLTLSHNSVKKHLKQEGTIPDNSDFLIARTCLYFLINNCKAKKTSPLLQYAAKHWRAHLSGKEQMTDESMTLLAIKFLKNSSNLITALQSLEHLDSSLLNGMKGWHAAVYFNLISWADHLITFGVDDKCANGQTALHWAVRHDRGKILDLLICKSANLNLIDEAARIDIRNNKNKSPLELAIQYGPTSIAQMMIESQKNVNAEIFQDWTLLRQVLSQGFNICSEMNEDGFRADSKEWDQNEPQVSDARNHIHFLTNLLLERGVDLNCPSTKTGWTPLVFAASKGDLYMMRRLLTCDKPAKVDLRDLEKKSPLWWAIHSETANGIQLLSDHGADVNETYSDGSTPLYEAVKKKNSKLVQQLVTLGANVNTNVNSRAAKRSTLLIEAIRLQDRDTALVLLNAEAKPDEQDANGKSPLLYAIKSGDKALVWLLISKNSVVESLSSRTNTRNSTYIQGPLEVALRHKDNSTAYLLCEHGASPNTVIDNKKRTLLQWAIQQNNIRAVRLLVHYGASINSQDENGFTSLHLAVLFRREDITTLLLSYTTNPLSLNIADNRSGSTPLSLAAQKGLLTFIRILILYGASCNAEDLDGLTAVHHTARQDFQEGLRMMLNSNGDPNVADGEGFTAVHHAVDGTGTSPGLISILAAAGADLEAKDKNGRTPLMIAAQRGKHEMVLYLLEKGANIEEEDENGYIALNYAQGYPHLEAFLQPIY
ncbi:ankyrin [Trichoderma compactum]